LCKLKAFPITLLNNFISSHLIFVPSLMINCRCQFPVFYSCRNISSGYSVFKSAVDILTFLPSLLCCSKQNKDWRDCGCRMILPCHMQANNQNMVCNLFCIIFGLQEHMPFAREECCRASRDVQTTIQWSRVLPGGYAVKTAPKPTIT
jgi:hypothetical protein